MGYERQQIGAVVSVMGGLLVLAGSLMLNGCATQKGVARASADARMAISRNQEIAQQLRDERQARKAQTAEINARIKRLNTRQTQLHQQLVANDARLARDEQRLSEALEKEKIKLAAVRAVANTQAAGADGFMPRLVNRARDAAKAPYKPLPPVPSALTKLDFPSYERVRFKGHVPGWPANGPIFPSFYSAGYLFHQAVNIYLLEGDKSIALKFPVKDFDFDEKTAHQLSGSVPLAGFSLYYPFTSKRSFDEFISFLGASYFRALGRGQVWGLSARGLAVDTAVPHHAEEFPYFRDFWLLPPKQGASTLGFYALLDSPSFTGAYHFIVHPGTQTTVDVDMVLFARNPVKRLGIAPLTSMYLQGGDGGPRYDALVRAAHDSDGLSIETLDDQWLWLPLSNPRRLMVEKIPLNAIKGFGLMQRSRRYADYQAWGMQYEKRPSAWVTPTGGDWNKGHIVLVELPTRTQTNDNITVFWEPATRIESGQELKFSYQIAWQGDHQTLPPLGHVVSTRYGRASRGKETYVINFRGGALSTLPQWVHVEPVVQITGPAQLLKAWVVKNAATGDWRLEFTLQRKGSRPARVRAYLGYDKRVLTETWDAMVPFD